MFAIVITTNTHCPSIGTGISYASKNISHDNGVLGFFFLANI